MELSESPKDEFNDRVYGYFVAELKKGFEMERKFIRLIYFNLKFRNLTEIYSPKFNLRNSASYVVLPRLYLFVLEKRTGD